jgi:hypothetical protein
MPCSQVVPLGAVGLTALTSIRIDPRYDYVVRRLICNITNDAGTAGLVLARFRSSSGYALFDDYIDVARYLNNAPWPVDWRLKGNDEIFIDLMAVNLTGAGNVYFQAWLDGARRGKAL